MPITLEAEIIVKEKKGNTITKAELVGVSMSSADYSHINDKMIEAKVKFPARVGKIETKTYMMNPVVLQDHDLSMNKLPAGKVVRLTKTDRYLVATVELREKTTAELLDILRAAFGRLWEAIKQSFNLGRGVANGKNHNHKN